MIPIQRNSYLPICLCTDWYLDLVLGINLALCE